MKNLFLAKTKPEEETIIEHTEKLIEQFNRLKGFYPNIKYLNWNILELACLYHDLGKMNTKFQKKLMKKLEKEDTLIDDLPDIDGIPHGYLSPAFLPLDELMEIYDEDELRILYQSIYYHHSREKLENEEPLQKVIEEDLVKYFRDFNYSKIKMVEELNPSYVRYTTSGRIPDEYDTKETFYQYVVTKGLLNKIDYAASGNIIIEEKNENLFEKTFDFLKNGGYAPNELQDYMIKHQDDNNIIIASTGIGKTEAALFWIGNNKGFFTLPLRVSINAIYDRVIKKIGFEEKNTALLHSETSSEYLKRNNNELDIEYYDKTKQLSLPLTVCTLDQLVDFIFKYEGFELKLATLAYSKLVIDEIQMYSPELVAYLIVALKYITELGGKFTILTATFPPIFEYFMNKEKIKFIKPNEPFYKKVNGKVQLRHRIKVIQQDINISHIKENYKDKKILIIVNTVRQAQKLYKELKDEIKDVNVNMFHSKFIQRDRALKECSILRMGDLKYKDTGIWITTQVVEASLDIDFDVLYTELSDIAGLLQRMGRVYRNRDLNGDYINIYIYTGKEKLPSGITSSDKSIIDYDIFKLSEKALIDFYGNNSEGVDMDESAKMKIVEWVYSLENLKGKNYYTKILKTINDMKDIKEYDYNKKQINLRNIENETVIPKLVYMENKKIIEENIKIINETKDYNKRLLAKNEIKKLTLSIPKYEYDYALKNSLISTDKIEVDKYTSIPIIKFDYTFENGLQKPKDLPKFDEDEQFI